MKLKTLLIKLINPVRSKSPQGDCSTRLLARAASNGINFYQKFISPFKRSSCVFYPICSEYTKEAINKYGAFKGIFLGFRRILRCHPWQKNRIDPVVSFDDARSAPKKASSKSTNRVDPVK